MKCNNKTPIFKKSESELGGLGLIAFKTICENYKQFNSLIGIPNDYKKQVFWKDL